MMKVDAPVFSLLKRREAARVIDAALPDAEQSFEASLIEAARAGDGEAFGKLYDLYAPMVHGILLARVPYAEADDLVQDVFVLAFKGLRGLRENGAFGGWLAMIARHRATDFHRRTRQTTELTEDIALHAAPDKEAREALAAIAALPEAYRETLLLRFVEGMTGPEIAARTGLTHASVRVNLSRGMKMLRGKLGLEKMT